MNTNLIGTEGRKCNGNLNDTLADKPNPKDQNLNCTNSASPDLDQSLKCQFYCKNGWHREGTICVENSCGSQSTGYLEQQVANAPLLITYVPICLDSGKNTTAETTIDDPRGQGARIKFERTYSCSLGNLTVSTANTKCTFTTQCNPGYHSDITTCQCEPNIYYVQFNGNGGTPSSYKLSQGYVYDTPFSLPNPTPTSFSRVGHTLS